MNNVYLIYSYYKSGEYYNLTNVANDSMGYRAQYPQGTQKQHVSYYCQFALPISAHIQDTYH